MANIYDPDFEEGERPDGFDSRRVRIGDELGTELIGCSLWEIPPGQAAYPYHFHFADEELLIVLTGEPSLRSPEGTRTLAEGEAVAFPRGEEGAHQIFNATEHPVRLLAVSNRGRPDVIVYPDTDKIGVRELPPQDSGFRAFFKREDRVSYWEGERFDPSSGGEER